MSVGAQSRTDQESAGEPDHSPTITVCASGPSRSVFIEADNTDGWIASDLTVDVRR
ncbi:hypothetical protein [Halobellus limi]|jgi:hypothetical protein|uniref:Uncharacterized protein n=1 Tax=Halobellus limi TaxID=699433 RepID=A0A1H6BHT9_9EURY|nr:hypothetical protein [Halobellus limi]SEG60289.1 hypothetical protein SAMN04488133_2856 [Halobellus limi]